jgi:hypothetical protein
MLFLAFCRIAAAVAIFVTLLLADDHMVRAGTEGTNHEAFTDGSQWV